MNSEAVFSLPSSLEDHLGPLELIRQVTTKPKSMVVIARSAHGPVVLKRADPTRLRHEYFLLTDVLPPTGIPAPRTLGLFDDEESSWLVTEFVDGRKPDLSIETERLVISRWVARLHVTGSAMTHDIPDSPVRVDPYDRLDQIERVLTGKATDATASIDLELCRQLRSLLPVVLDIGATLPVTLTHGDLAEENFVLTPAGPRGLDWEKTEFGSPLIDLWIVDPEEYRTQQVELGVSPGARAPLAAFPAGTVLAQLAHNIAGKSPDRRHRYLRTAMESAERALALHKESM